MDRIEITAAIGMVVLIAFTLLAHVGDRVTQNIASRIETTAAAKAPVRTRIISSVLDEGPTVVGSTGRRADAKDGKSR